MELEANLWQWGKDRPPTGTFNAQDVNQYAAAQSPVAAASPGGFQYPQYNAGPMSPQNATPTMSSYGQGLQASPASQSGYGQAQGYQNYNQPATGGYGQPQMGGYPSQQAYGAPHGYPQGATPQGYGSQQGNYGYDGRSSGRAPSHYGYGH